MTAKHSASKPTPISERIARAHTPILAGHVTIVHHADNSVSWHLARVDTASRRMVFPYAGVFEAPAEGGLSLITCLHLALVEARELDRLMDE